MTKVKTGWETKKVSKQMENGVVMNIHPTKTGWVVDCVVDNPSRTISGEPWKGWKKLIPYSELFPKDIHPLHYEHTSGYGMLYANLMYYYDGDRFGGPEKVKRLPITGR